MHFCFPYPPLGLILPPQFSAPPAAAEVSPAPVRVVGSNGVHPELAPPKVKQEKNAGALSGLVDAYSGIPQHETSGAQLGPAGSHGLDKQAIHHKKPIAFLD